MLINGFTIWFAIIAAISGVALLVALEFLRARHKEKTMPTLLFWQQAAGDARRNWLGGPFGRLFQLLFLILIVLIFAFTLLLPDTADKNNPVIILDVSSATDIEPARHYARHIVSSASRSALIISGSDNIIAADFDDDPATALAALDQVVSDNAGYSALSVALRQGRALAGDQPIYVITGQNIEITGQNVRPVLFPAATEIVMPVAVSVYAQEAKPAIEAYCRADSRFVYVTDEQAADIVITSEQMAVLGNWRGAGFVDRLTGLLLHEAGLTDRNIPHLAGSGSKPDKVSGRFLGPTCWLIAGLTVILILEIYLYKSGRIA